MKLTCDLCGNALQMNADRQGATCTGCGMNYTLESLRQTLKTQPQSSGEPGCVFIDTPPVQPEFAQSCVQQELIINRKFDLQAMLYMIIIIVDGVEVAQLSPRGGEVNIPLSPGEHQVYAIVKRQNKVEQVMDTLTFTVDQHNWCALFHVRRTAWNAYWQLDLVEDVDDITRT